MSNFIEISEFAKEKGYSVKTLKRRYGDLIRREGRKSFIDPTEYDKAFVDRSRKGRKEPRNITESTSIPRIQLQIPKTQLKISMMHVVHTDLESSAKAEPEKQRKTILQNNARRVQIGIKREESQLEKLFARIAYLIKRESQTLLALENAETGYSEKKQ